MLENKINIEEIKKEGSIPPPLNINISHNLDETRKWISPMNLIDEMKEQINRINEDEKNFDMYLHLYLRHFHEYNFNTRTGYGKSKLNRSPNNSAGEKDELVEEIEKYKQELLFKKIFLVDLLNAIFCSSLNSVGIDTINDFILFISHGWINRYNEKIFALLEKNESWKYVEIKRSDPKTILKGKTVRGLYFDNIGPIFLLPEFVMDNSKLGFSKTIASYFEKQDFKYLIEIHIHLEKINQIAKKEGIGKGVLTRLINMIIDKGIINIDKLMTQTKNSKRNRLIELSKKQINDIFEILKKLK